MTTDLRKKIYELLKEEVIPIVRCDRDLMNVLSKIWDVYSIKATGEDLRYRVLGDEIEKHYIMNDDWEDDKLFLGILNVLEDEDKLISFTEVLSVMIYSEKGFDAYKTKLSSLLKEEGYSLNEEQKDQRLIIRINKGNSTPILLDKARTFYVCASNVYNIVNFYEKDISYPNDNDCFILTNNNWWNDYTYKTRYRLYYYLDGELHEVGEVKIMKKHETDTSQVLPNTFVALSDEYCSLGATISYYDRMKDLFKKEAYTILRQLRDTAFYESIYKQFEDDKVYKTSLVRENEAERAKREGRYIVYGRNMEEAYSFSYSFKPPYSIDNEEVFFNYKYKGEDFERIIGLIGENGVGKTSLIKGILQSLINNENQFFTGLRPLFSSVLMISYSPFDHYPISSDDQQYFINYEYSGLMKEKAVMFSTEEQVDILFKNITKIYKRGESFYRIWKTFVNKVIPPNLFEPIFKKDDGITIDKDFLLELCNNASSGETMFLYSISAIMAKIRSNSLIIMDEPEQHLHPGAVTALMQSLYKILKRYDSYALIATHSPYVIRELVSPNVLIFNRFDNGICIKRIGIESFGENVAVLSDMVFDNMSKDKNYEKLIEEIVKENEYDYESSIEALQKGPNPLSLNAKLLVRTVINNKAV